MLKKITDDISLEEMSSSELIKAIYTYKNGNQNSKLKTTVKICIFCIILPIFICFFNILQIRISYIHELMQDLLNLSGILIGFTLTALSIVGTGLYPKAAKNFFEYESTVSKNNSIYKIVLFEFLDYLYSLLATLAFIIFALILYPYAYHLHFARVVLSIIFFYTLASLIFWNIFSIKSLIYNLYSILILNAKAISLTEK